MTAPTVRRIVRRDRQPVTVDGRTFLATVWVGLGELDPDRADPEDFTLPEVTHRYLSKRGLTTAIRDGSAFLA
ncbi:MAG TPA: hypothetical protein VHD87_15040 [Acidimicrobiales bacterium]|nr:hypothetical protein [Acidimicrobiales bacterium]